MIVHNLDHEKVWQDLASLRTEEKQARRDADRLTGDLVFLPGHTLTHII